MDLGTGHFADSRDPLSRPPAPPLPLPPPGHSLGLPEAVREYDGRSSSAVTAAVAHLRTEVCRIYFIRACRSAALSDLSRETSSSAFCLCFGWNAGPARQKLNSKYFVAPFQIEMDRSPFLLESLWAVQHHRKEERHCHREMDRDREREARRRRSEENSARFQRLKEREEATRQQAAEGLRRWIEIMCREEMQERREKEEAASRRQREELRALERDVGVALPATPPPRVIRVGEAAPVSAISEAGL